jgi:glyceraldehyde 3-phosphate dehydrogenase
MNDKKIRVGINGLGRIGRAIFRTNQIKNYFDVVVVNEINPDVNNIAYTLNYDTLYGKQDIQFKSKGNRLVNEVGDIINVHHESRINNLDWNQYDVDYVIDASGILNNVEHAQDLIKKQNVKNVFVTHSPNNVDFTMVLGANEDQLDVNKHRVISTSICDATALGPVLSLINKSFGINSGYVTTLHPWLNYQNLMDGPSSSWSVPGEIYHHYALGRSINGNMIPKPTSAIEATCRVVDGLTEQMIGSFSYRTPTAIVGSADITLNLKNNTDKLEIIKIFEEKEKTQSLKIIHNNIDPLVSLDFLRSEYSAIVDHRWTNVINGSLLKMVLWYDNEWGYSSRVIDQVKYISEKAKESK